MPPLQRCVASGRDHGRCAARAPRPTLPRRIRAPGHNPPAMVAPFGSANSEHGGPGALRPHVGAANFSGDRSGIARLRAPELRPRANTWSGPCPRSRCRNRSARRQAPVDATIVKLLVGGGLSPLALGTQHLGCLFGAWARVRKMARPAPEAILPSPIRQQRSRDMLVKAPLGSRLHDTAPRRGRHQTPRSSGAQFEITAHACHVSRLLSNDAVLGDRRHDKYPAAGDAAPYSGWLTIFRQLDDS